MITRLLAPGQERIYDDEVGLFVETSVVPCHRCGVCCERWQPLVTPEEISRLASHLGISDQNVYEMYTEHYPFDDSLRFLLRDDGACVFLRRDGTGHSLCAVHPARPDACRAWTASLARRECVDGLSRFDSHGCIVTIGAVYANATEQADFTRVVRGDDG